MKRAMRLGMDGDDVGAGPGEGFEERVGRRDHQMHVHHRRHMRPKRRHDRRADGQVGHEMPVHHIHMHPVRARRLDRPHLLAQPREIGRQDGGGDLDRAGEGRLVHRVAHFSRSIRLDVSQRAPPSPCTSL